MQALVIREPWISLILAGKKTWEMRSGGCNVRGPIAIIRKGSGQVVGTAEIVDSLPTIESLQAYAAAENFHAIPKSEQESAFAQNWRTPWVLKSAKPLSSPVGYKHGSGPVTWVNLAPEVAGAVIAQAGIAVEPPTPAAATVSVAEVTAAETTKVGPLPRSRMVRASGNGATSGKRKRIIGRIEEDRCVIPISDGNIKNGHFYLRTVLSFFPSDCVGGSDQSQPAPRMVTLAFDKRADRDDGYRRR